MIDKPLRPGIFGIAGWSQIVVPRPADLRGEHDVEDAAEVQLSTGSCPDE